MHPLRHRPGFTVIEILICIGLMAILLALSALRMTGQMPKFRLNGAARQLKSDLVAARMQAVSHNHEYKIFFLDNHRYMLLDDKDNDGTADTGETQTTKDIQDDYPDVTLRSNNNPIFRPGGTAANLATITLSNTSGSRVISISSAGRIKIK